MKELIKKFIPKFLIGWYHFLLAFLAALFYRFPSWKIKLIGVTGTNGKTTTTEMIAKIFEEAGFKIALMNSIRFKIGKSEEFNMLKMTMPGRFRIQKFLREALNAGCQYAILEVTSEGIKQHRHRFLNFQVAVFTNLTPEHIEAHRGFENYRAAKGRLFQKTKNIHIINLDDDNANYFLKFPAREKYLYQLKAQNSKFKITIQNSKFKKEIEKDFKINLKLPGEFNIYNALAAICVGFSQGIDFEICKLALEKIDKIPGRMEQVISQPFKVIVDYAFTPNALLKVYQTLRNTKYGIRDTKLICILGACGGGRDKWKRPVLGQIASKYCDEIIVTNEDPYDENPLEIIEQVAKGTNGKAKKILDRREAIRESLKLAKEGDIVVITGKGCEPWLCEKNGKKIPWDDRKIVKEEFDKIKK